MEKPADLFARAWEWNRLVGFVNQPGAEPRLGLVYGRRRQGKSLLTSRLATAFDGFYWEAEETEAAANLESFGSAWSHHLKSSGPIRFSSWRDALAAALRHGSLQRGPVVVIDEIQRVIAKVPELPSVMQSLLGPAGVGASSGGTRLIVCGSAFGELRRLIDGDSPLRGRASLELVVEPFDYRTAADFWGLRTNPTTAFHLHALVGGTPAYLTLAGDDTPSTDGNLAAWVERRLLDPSSSLFREGRIVVNEDAQLGDRQLYWGLLSAIADGARRWGELDQILGVGRGSLQHSLAVACDAGWVRKVADPLRANRASYELTEPMVRFHRIVIERHQRRLNQRRGADVWVDVAPDVAARVYGPHLETVAQEWLVAHAAHATIGGAISEVGPSKVEGVGQVDLVAVEATAQGGRRPILVGEAKARNERTGVDVLDRLDAAARKLDRSDNIVRLIVSAAGFTTDLSRVGRGRSNVQLVDLNRLYHGE